MRRLPKRHLKQTEGQLMMPLASFSFLVSPPLSSPHHFPLASLPLLPILLLQLERFLAELIELRPVWGNSHAQIVPCAAAGAPCHTLQVRAKSSAKLSKLTTSELRQVQPELAVAATNGTATCNFTNRRCCNNNNKSLYK